jgi:hypothetical protein
VALAAAVLVFAFAVLAAFALNPHAADEGIYFYGARRVAAGVWPYRDFFHAHPPLHLAPLALMSRFFGHSYALAKAPTTLWAAFQGVAALVLTLRFAGTFAAAGRGLVHLAAATMAGGLFLFSESVLKAAASDTGICQASGMVALAALCLAFRRPVAAGLAAGCAPLILLQTAPAAAMVVLASALAGRRAFFRAAGASAGLFAGVLLVVRLVGGPAFFAQVFWFHLAKSGTADEGARQLGFVLFDNWTLFAGALAGLLALVMAGGPRRILGLGGAVSMIFTFAAMATRPRVFPFYFQPAFFPAALLAGAGLVTVLDRLPEVIARVRKVSGFGPRLGQVPAAVHVPLLAALTLLGPLASPLAAVISPRRAEQVRTYAQTYDWVDAPGIGPLNGAVRALFWQNGQRHPGTNPNAVTQYLWQRSRWLDALPAMAASVRREATARPEVSLFGDSTVAPLVALEAGVKITGDLVDTNVQRVRAGNLSADEILALLQRHPRALLLFGGHTGIGTLPELRRLTAQHYEVVETWPTRNGATYTLWRRGRGRFTPTR